MANSTTATRTLPAQGEAAIEAVVPVAQVEAQQVFTGTIAKFAEGDKALGKARDGMDRAKGENDGLRVQLLCALAAEAAKRGWDAKYAEQGIMAAVEVWERDKLNGARYGTLRTFVGECKRVIHPQAREHVADDLATAKRVWAEEGKAVKEAAEGETVETPLRDAYSRMYQLAFGSTGLVAARGVDADSDDPTKARRAAAAGDPAKLAEVVEGSTRSDPKRAKRMITKALDSLKELVNEFPHDDVKEAIEFLDGIEVNSLVAARDKAKRPRLQRVGRKARVEAETQNAPVSMAAVQAMIENALDK